MTTPQFRPPQRRVQDARGCLCCDPRRSSFWSQKFGADLVRSPLLDRRMVEFSGLCHAGGLDAPAGVMRETGGLLPIAPCGRSSL